MPLGGADQTIGLGQLVKLFANCRIIQSHPRKLVALELANQQDPYNLYRTAWAYRLKGDEKQERVWLERTAGFNSLNNFNHTLVRHRAARELSIR